MIVPGDGIGSEVTEQGVRVLQASRRTSSWSTSTSAPTATSDGVTLPDDVFARRRDDFSAIFLGALGDPRVPSNVHAKEILLGSRFRLDLFINQRPIKLLDERRSVLRGKGPDDIDIMVFRENTEDLYTGMGGTFKKGTPDEVAQEVCIATRKGVERIVRAAFAYAHDRGLKRVCMADKSNAMEHRRDGSGCTGRSPTSTWIDASHLYVDVLAMELVRARALRRHRDVQPLRRHHHRLGAILQGGIGLPGNIHGKVSLFEPVRRRTSPEGHRHPRRCPHRGDDAGVPRALDAAARVQRSVQPACCRRGDPRLGGSSPPRRWRRGARRL